MKAILVFDVHEFTYEAINNYFAGDIILCLGNDGHIDFKDVILQPMPQKKDGDFVWVDIDTCDESYIHGWNDCVDVMLGEEE